MHAPHRPPRRRPPRPVLLAVLGLGLSAAPIARAQAPATRDGFPLAGFNDGHFYLRNASDTLRLYPNATLLLDADYWAGKGVKDLPGPGLSPRLKVRTARIGLGGAALGAIAWQFTLAAEGQPLDNVNGTQTVSAAAPGQTPTLDSARYAPAETAGNSAHVLDAWVNVRQSDYFNVMVGQYRVPFTMETATPIETLPFHERAMSSSDLGAPGARDIGATAWGDVRAAGLAYYVGAFDGDGLNRPGVDARGDLIARVTWRPFAQTASLVRDAEIGVSVRAGSRDGSRVNYDYPAMTTQQGFVFWSPRYVDSLNRIIHVIPADAQRALGAELFVPVDRFELRSEVVLVNNDTREAVEGYQATNTERIGALKGGAGYVLIGYTLLGPPHFMGLPGPGVRPRTLDFSKSDSDDSAQALELLVRFEALSVKYEGALRGGQSDSTGGLDGDIKARSIGLGMNYWITRHARVSLNSVYYLFPDSDSSKNRAVAPGNVAGVASAHAELELGARLGVMF
jgi:phosphate-selective porin OprO and OprP